MKESTGFCEPLGGPIGPQTGQLGPIWPQNRIPRVLLINSAPRSAKSDGNSVIFGNFLVFVVQKIPFMLIFLYGAVSLVSNGEKPAKHKGIYWMFVFVFSSFSDFSYFSQEFSQSDLKIGFLVSFSYFLLRDQQNRMEIHPFPAMFCFRWKFLYVDVPLCGFCAPYFQASINHEIQKNYRRVLRK